MNVWQAHQTINRKIKMAKLRAGCFRVGGLCRGARRTLDLDEKVSHKHQQMGIFYTGRTLHGGKLKSTANSVDSYHHQLICPHFLLNIVMTFFPCIKQTSKSANQRCVTASHLG